MDDDAFLFNGLRGPAALKVPTLNNLVKDWCSQANLKGNYGSHTLRKTWGYMQTGHSDSITDASTRSRDTTTNNGVSLHTGERN